MSKNNAIKNQNSPSKGNPPKEYRVYMITIEGNNHEIKDLDIDPSIWMKHVAMRRANN